MSLSRLSDHWLLVWVRGCLCSQLRLFSFTFFFFHLRVHQPGSWWVISWCCFFFLLTSVSRIFADWCEVLWSPPFRGSCLTHSFWEASGQPQPHSFEVHHYSLSFQAQEISQWMMNQWDHSEIPWLHVHRRPCSSSWFIEETLELWCTQSSYQTETAVHFPPLHLEAFVFM